uniref:hypothetical protein n=1 Tax=Thermoactinomyces daqus TaxID=1329516 RepID=UPI001C693071
RKLSPPAPMVLGVHPWESRSLPGKDTSHLVGGGFFIVVFVIFISFDSSSFSILSHRHLFLSVFHSLRRESSRKS